ncbi:radical SAM/SPASM domain-containing protein [Enterococcus sp. JM4C]|uniref:radical SAM/SPASM domain-containing protein n=1 Tax=Candidatus Enterococcus huntleyi TaxID=1857217 RepID=UPI00137AEB49|nr:SPASM domain-containing protein [Enterococcus sp. JM4C]KAF1295640.1 radical SAM/SPASM domain-containing protein [Enterococcus sp. JM4C]
MKHISVLVKPASALCNIRCKYCFYADVSSLREVRSFGKMKSETAEKMIEHLFVDLVDGDELTLAFQGGEPTLAGLTYYKNIVAFVEQQTKNVTVHYALQTNGLLINERWCQFLKEHQFLVGLSIDGHPLYHDLNRVDPKGRGTFQKVLATKELFDTYGIEYNILCVLTNPLAKEAKKVYRFLQEQSIQYVQFIPCLDELEAKKRSSYALTPQRFASFYGQLFKFWLAELQSGHYRSVKLFDDLMNLFVGGRVTACGILGNCQIQYVIEADGSVYPCDFYVLDEYRMGYIQESGLKELFEQEISKKFLCEKPDYGAFCHSCLFQKACNGGCKRMKDAIYVTKGQDFCGYQQVLTQFLPHKEEIMELVGRIAK